MGCVGDDLDCTERMVSICAKDGHGPYNYQVTTGLVNAAKKDSIDYAVDIYPFYGSDADAALSAGRMPVTVLLVPVFTLPTDMSAPTKTV